MKRNPIKMGCLGAKEYSGYSRSHIKASPPSSPTPAGGSRANLSWRSPVSSTGRSLSPLPRKLLWPNANKPLVPTMPNSPEAQPRETMSGRSSPVSTEPNSYSASNPSPERTRSTGNPYGNPLRPATFYPSRRQYVYQVTELSDQFMPIMRSQLEWSAAASCTGATLELGSRVSLGKPPVWMLILRIPDQSSGVVIEINETLSSMNFVAVSTSATCCDGLIVIRSTWKSKGHPYHWSLPDSLLLPTSPRNLGTRK